MKPKRPQGNIVIAGVGCPLGSFADALFATPAVSSKPANIRPHTITLKTARDRAYDRAVAGGCKSLGKTNKFNGKPVALTAATDGRDWGTPVMDSHRTHKSKYARGVTETITGAVTDFASHFKPSDSWRRQPVLPNR